jgi:hypothetical protein
MEELLSALGKQYSLNSLQSAKLTDYKMNPRPLTRGE